MEYNRGKMKNRYKIFLCIVLLVSLGLFGYSSWHQWNANQKTTLERMRPIPPIAEFNHGARIQAIAFSPTNPDLIVTTGEDYTIKVWNRHNTQAPEVVLTGFLEHDGSGDTYSVDCLAFSPTGEWLIRKINWMLEFWDVSIKRKLIPLRSLLLSQLFHLTITISQPLQEMLDFGISVTQMK